jgi:hypothetical protein
MDCEVESIDGDYSMHYAHSEHIYIPLVTGWWHFSPQVILELPGFFA